MRSILVDARPGPAGRVRIQTALSLAREFNGHVRLVVDTPVDRFVAIDGMGGSLISAEALRAAMSEDDAFAAQIEGQLAREDVCCDVVRAESEPIEALATAALLADVVVVSRADPIAGDLPLATGCPVLAVNDDRPVIFPLNKAVVAWDGGGCAANALRASVPLLAAAGEVTVLVVDADTSPYPATDIASYLSRHGICAELKPVQRSGPVGATLTRELTAIAPDLLVMGAYGHGRLREFLFGGVTAHFLETPLAPALFMAH